MDDVIVWPICVGRWRVNTLLLRPIHSDLFLILQFHVMKFRSENNARSLLELVGCQNPSYSPLTLIPGFHIHPLSTQRFTSQTGRCIKNQGILSGKMFYLDLSIYLSTYLSIYLSHQILCYSLAENGHSSTNVTICDYYLTVLQTLVNPYVVLKSCLKFSCTPQHLTQWGHRVLKCDCA